MNGVRAVRLQDPRELTESLHRAKSAGSCQLLP